AFQVLPREVHGDAGIVAQLLARGRVIVGEEGEAAFVEAFEQDDAGARTPFVERGDGHRVGFADVLGRLVVPLPEQGQRRGVRVVEDSGIVDFRVCGSRSTGSVMFTLYVPARTRVIACVRVFGQQAGPGARSPPNG